MPAKNSKINKIIQHKYCNKQKKCFLQTENKGKSKVQKWELYDQIKEDFPMILIDYLKTNNLVEVQNPPGTFYLRKAKNSKILENEKKSDYKKKQKTQNNFEQKNANQTQQQNIENFFINNKILIKPEARNVSEFNLFVDNHIIISESACSQPIDCDQQIQQRVSKISRSSLKNIQKLSQKRQASDEYFDNQKRRGISNVSRSSDETITDQENDQFQISPFRIPNDFEMSQNKQYRKSQDNQNLDEQLLQDEYKEKTQISESLSNEIIEISTKNQIFKKIQAQVIDQNQFEKNFDFQSVDNSKKFEEKVTQTSYQEANQFEIEIDELCIEVYETSKSKNQVFDQNMYEFWSFIQHGVPAGYTEVHTDIWITQPKAIICQALKEYHNYYSIHTDAQIYFLVIFNQDNEKKEFYLPQWVPYDYIRLNFHDIYIQFLETVSEDLSNFFAQNELQIINHLF